MRRVKQRLGYIGIILASLSSIAFAAKVTKGYTFDFNPPHTSEWQLVQNEFDTGGYSRVYALEKVENAKDQNMMISYGKYIKTSLKEAMQEVVDNINKTSCKQRKSHILEQNKTSLVFYTSIDQCSNGKSLYQTFKVFNMPDGQYSIIYTADPKKISASTITQMQKAVTKASLVPIK